MHLSFPFLRGFDISSNPKWTERRERGKTCTKLKSDIPFFAFMIGITRKGGLDLHFRMVFRCPCQPPTASSELMKGLMREWSLLNYHPLLAHCFCAHVQCYLWWCNALGAPTCRAGPSHPHQFVAVGYS